MDIVAILPARMGSSRFPGKPLANILGMPMIEHVYRRTSLARSLKAVYVATCDEEIRDAVERFGGSVIMTSPAHQRASDRVAEAARHIHADIVVMVQGDEPMLHPDMIDTAVRPFHSDASVSCVNLTARIATEAEFYDPNTIKVVMNDKGDALYFSRSPIPALPASGFSSIRAFKQVCIIPFRYDALQLYAALEPTPLEIAESIDMLRFLEHGYKVRMVETKIASHAVDTPEDLKLVEQLMSDDPLTRHYMH